MGVDVPFFSGLARIASTYVRARLLMGFDCLQFATEPTKQLAGSGSYKLDFDYGYGKFYTSDISDMDGQKVLMHS